MPVLLPCPFCASTAVRLVFPDDVRSPYYVTCATCGTCGPTHGRDAEAMRLWNKRKETER